MLESLLDELARRRGIGDAYHDYRGEWRRFSARTKTAILSAMGCDVRDVDTVAREIAGLDAERWRIRAPASVAQLEAARLDPRGGIIVEQPAVRIHRDIQAF